MSDKMIEIYGGPKLWMHNNDGYYWPESVYKLWHNCPELRDMAATEIPDYIPLTFIKLLLERK